MNSIRKNAATAPRTKAGSRSGNGGDDADCVAPFIKYRPRSKRVYFDVGIGSICLGGADTGRNYCLLEVALAPGMGVPRHMHTREDEAYYVLAGELEIIVADEVFVLKAGDTLIAPRDIPHQLRNSGDIENHYLLMFSPSGFEEFLKATSVPAPDNAPAPTRPPPTAVRNVFELAAKYGIQFDNGAEKAGGLPRGHSRVDD